MKTALQFINFAIFLLVITKGAPAQTAGSLKKAKAIELMKLAQLEYVKIKDYQATIISTERRGNRIRKTEYLITRYLHPGNVYLKWLPGPYQGMQASYVPSRDKKNCFKGRETGILGLIGTKTWHNNDPLIKILYPHHFTIQQTNLGYLFEKTQYILKKGTQIGKLSVTSIKDTTDKYTHRPVTSVIVKLSNDPKDELLWSKVQLFFDNEHKLPLHFILYDLNGKLSGDYAFTKFKKNTGLSLNDFDL